MPWNSNLWKSKAEKEKFPEQKNTDHGILTKAQPKYHLSERSISWNLIVVTTNSLNSQLL